MIAAAPYRCAVVILSYNSAQWLDLFLPGVVAAAGTHYLPVVVDHASTDGTAALLAAQYPDLSVLTLKENHGFAWGYAEALKQIDAEYYVLLSADFEVTPNWFPPLQLAMDAHPEMAACQPKIRYYKEKEYFEYAGAAGGLMDSLGYFFCRGRIFDTLEQDTGQYDDDCKIFWASGGCLMVRRRAYDEVAGLDAAFFAHMEEIDLCWRMQNAGYTIGYVADSTVYHVGGSVISYGSPQKTFYNFRNSYFLLLKNERTAKLLWLLPLRLVLDGVAALQFLAKGQGSNVLAVLKAHFSFYAAIPRLLKARKQTRIFKKVQASLGIFSGSIILRYFFKQQKKFSQLGMSLKKL